MYMVHALPQKQSALFSKYERDFGINEIKSGMRLRLRSKKRGLNISYSDGVGYDIALRSNIKFLTG
jgi:hypothetical protein